MALKLLHIADVHLDKPFGWLGSRGRDQRRQLKETFRQIVDLALSERVDALLVAGDLFDNNAPSQDTIDLVRAQLARLRSSQDSSVHVFLLPGTHDRLDDGSVYRKVDLAACGEHVHVFEGSGQSVTVEKLNLTVHGRANLTPTSADSPLGGLVRNPGTRFNVALAHGSILMPGTENDFPMAPKDLAQSEMDYIALGHWHTYHEYPTSRGKACYSGPPELLGKDDHGYVLIVQLDGLSTTVERRSVGKRRHEELPIALEHVESAEELKEQLRQQADGNLALSVVLTGLRRLDLVIDQNSLVSDLSGEFFALTIIDRSHPKISEEELASFPEELVIGQFVRRMNGLIQGTADPDERRIREAALQVGVALLQGRKVL